MTFLFLSPSPSLSPCFPPSSCTAAGGTASPCAGSPQSSRTPCYTPAILEYKICAKNGGVRLDNYPLKNLFESLCKST